MPGNVLDYINQSNTWQDDPNAQWRQNAPGSVPVGSPGAAAVPSWWPYWSGAAGWYPQGQARAQPEWFMPENYGGGPTGGQPTYNLAPPTLPYRGWQGGGPAQQPAAMPRQSVASPQPTGAMPVVPIDPQTGRPTGGGADTGPATPPQWLAMLAQQQAGRTPPNALQQAPGQMNWMQQIQQQNPSFFDMLMRWIGLRQQQYGAPGQAQGRRPGDGPGLTTTPNDNGFILL